MQPTLTAPVRQNLLAMRSTADMLAQTQTRLATGKKVNSALDNPSSYFQSRALDSRAQQLTQLLDSMAMAQSTVEAADNGLSAIGDLVNQARGLAQQALQAEGSISTATATNAFDSTNAGSLDVTVDGVTTTVSYTAGASSADFAADITSQVDGASASVDGTGRLVIEAGDGRSLAVAAGSGANGGFTGGETVAVEQSEVRRALAQQFNEIRTQIDEVARDAGFNGVNLLGGDSLTVGFNEKTASSGERSSLTLDGQTVDSVSLGISQVQAYNAGSNPGGDFQLDSAINAVMDELTTAVSDLESMASSYASDQAVLQIREDFTNDMINTLQAGSDKLTLADANEEGAKMLALQTRQELASTALALSAQAEQSVLRLF
ncbi:MAG: hypothetical protein AAF321_00990 [Pseudomonadota bacterium]